MEQHDLHDDDDCGYVPYVNLRSGKETGYLPSINLPKATATTLCTECGPGSKFGGFRF